MEQETKTRETLVDRRPGGRLCRVLLLETAGQAQPQRTRQWVEQGLWLAHGLTAQPGNFQPGDSRPGKAQPAGKSPSGGFRLWRANWDAQDQTLVFSSPTSTGDFTSGDSREPPVEPTSLKADHAEPRDLDLIVFVQRQPTEWTETAYRSIHQKYPLARLITVWGPWCMGGHRSGHPWPGSIYVSWSAWTWQAICFFRQWQNGDPTLWDPPVTRSTVDRLSQASRPATSAPREQEREHALPAQAIQVGLVTAIEGLEQSLRLACNSMGWQVVADLRQADLNSGRLDQRCQAWIWELALPHVSAAEFWHLRRQLPGPCLVLIGFYEVQSAWMEELQKEPPEVADRDREPNAHPAIAPQEPLHLAATLFLHKPFLLSELQAAVGYLCLQDRSGPDRFQAFHHVDYQ